MRAAIDTVREFGERTVRVKWVLPAYLLIGIIAFGLAYSATSYANDQREESERLAAEAQYAADTASFENARDELARCLQRVEARDQLRGVFLSIFELIDERSPEGSTFTAEAAGLLDRDYPPLSEADCPPDPVAPTPPPSLTPGG